MTTRKLAATVATLAAVAMLATACSSGGGTTPTTGATGGGNSAAAGGQTLTICMPNGPQTNNSNPFLNTASGNSLGYRWAIYEPLAQVNDTRPANKPEPWLASAWEWNTDYTQLKITARDGVKWSDGQDFTAADIAFSLQLRKDHDALNTEGISYGDITTDGNVVTVSFTTGQFVNQIKILQLFVVPQHIWSTLADPETDTNQKPVGTGPYTLTSWTDQAVILDQNPSYWGGKLAVPQLRYTSYSGNDTETTALATGECQWGWTFIADYQNVYVAKDAAHNKVFMPAGLGIDQLMLNVTKPPFNDVAVRKALNMVVDRKQASEVAESGLFPELTSITGIPTPAGDSFIADAYKNQTYKVDVAGAKKVLTDAGYTYDGDKLIGKDGKQVSFKLWVPAGWNDYVTSQQLIAQSAQSIGMNATTDTPTADAWFAANNTGDFDAALHWTNTGMTPFEMYSDMFDPAYYLPVGQQANWNLGRFQDDAAAAAFKAYTDATDDAGRKAALDTIQKIFVEQVPAIAVDARPAAAEYSTKYYVGWPDDGNAYANPQPTVANATWILTKLKPAS